MSEKKFVLILLLYLISIQHEIYPYYLSGLACAVLCFSPTTFLEIAVFGNAISQLIYKYSNIERFCFVVEDKRFSYIEAQVLTATKRMI